MMLNFIVRRRLEREYERGIMRLYRMILEKTRGLSLDATLRYLESVSLTESVARLARNLASRMVTLSATHNTQSWRAAARQGSMSLEMRKLIQREMTGKRGFIARSIVTDNARLISSVPKEIAGQITQEMLKRYNKGMRYEEFAQELTQRLPGLMRSRARLIARTELSKANEAMTEARSRDLGISCYIWRSSHDERVRHAHEQMDGVLCFWDSPPDPEAFFDSGSKFGSYHAGCCPNCRCYAEPVVDLRYLPDRIMVSVSGRKPVSMTRRAIQERWGQSA